MVLEALRNTQLEGVKDHLLFEVRRTEFRRASPETRILAVRSTATDFFAYFFHPRKKVGPRWPSDLLFEARRADLKGPRPEARISMTAPGYVVRGKSNSASINSAAHGAGRIMSRTHAKRSLNKHRVAEYISKAGVEVIGSGLDEAPMVYKNIQKVMAAQKSLVDIVGLFQPKIVRMCGN